MCLSGNVEPKIARKSSESRKPRWKSSISSEVEPRFVKKKKKKSSESRKPRWKSIISSEVEPRFVTNHIQGVIEILLQEEEEEEERGEEEEGEIFIPTLNEGGG